MNTLEIWNALGSNKYTKKYFKGVFPLDRIPRIISKRPALLVVNTDKSNRPGRHWVAIYLPSKGNPEYFDSYGLKPIHKEFIKFFKRQNFTKILHNEMQLQDFLSTVCGQYCCVYLLNRAKNKTLQQFIKKYFKSGKFRQNDKRVQKLFLKNFKLHTTPNMFGSGSRQCQLDKSYHAQSCTAYLNKKNYKYL